MPVNDHLPKLTQLIDQGTQLLAQVRSYEGSKSFYLPDNISFQAHEWVSQVGSLLTYIASTNAYIIQQCNKLLSDQNLNGNSMPLHIVSKFQALLKTTLLDIKEGRFHGWEYNVSAQDFDEFLKYAELFHKGGKKMESAVIASAVLEDTVKTIARKFQQSDVGSLEEVIQRLADSKIFTSVKKSRVQSFATTRNRAFHAQWEEFDLKDVGLLIEGVRSLLDDFIAENVGVA